MDIACSLYKINKYVRRKKIKDFQGKNISLVIRTLTSTYISTYTNEVITHRMHDTETVNVDEEEAHT
jgi:hypothetical protein